MARFKTTDRDRHEMTLRFALILFDHFTRQNRLLGNTTVRIANQPVKEPFIPLHKAPDAVYAFPHLEPGRYVADIASDEDTPYYRKANIPFTLPTPNKHWPAFPDLTLADLSLPLDDPAQPQAYRDERRLATLKPTTAYPFPEDATLLRGTVRAGTNLLPGAKVEVVDADLEYETAENGDFVIFFPRVRGARETVAVRVTHALHLPVETEIAISRGATEIGNFVMT